VTETAAWKDDGEGTVRARRGGVGGVVGFTVAGVGFYRAESRRGRAERLQLSA
jgi:predicted nucleic acid-binding Zn ribbon protein